MSERSEIRSGVRLLVTTLGAYRRDLALAILGAVVWMAMVIAVPFLTSQVIDRGITAGRRDLIMPLSLAARELGSAQ